MVSETIGMGFLKTNVYSSGFSILEPVWMQCETFTGTHFMIYNCPALLPTSLMRRETANSIGVLDIGRRANIQHPLNILIICSDRLIRVFLNRSSKWPFMVNVWLMEFQRFECVHFNLVFSFSSSYFSSIWEIRCKWYPKTNIFRNQ